MKPFLAKVQILQSGRTHLTQLFPHDQEQVTACLCSVAVRQLTGKDSHGMSRPC